MKVLPHANKHASIIFKILDHLLWHLILLLVSDLKPNPSAPGTGNREDSSAQWQSHDTTDLPQHQFADHHRGLIFEVLAEVEKENTPQLVYQSIIGACTRILQTWIEHEAIFRDVNMFQGASSIPDFGSEKGIEKGINTFSHYESSAVGFWTTRGSPRRTDCDAKRQWQLKIPNGPIWSYKSVYKYGYKMV
jgi:hypothetical protein